MSTLDFDEVIKFLTLKMGFQQIALKVTLFVKYCATVLNFLHTHKSFIKNEIM